MKLLYFAAVRERIGRGSEEADLPASVTTVDGLLAWLRDRGEPYAHALAPEAAVRVALDRRHASPGTPIGTAGEAAFFPPMTGG